MSKAMMSKSYLTEKAELVDRYGEDTLPYL